MIKIPYICLTCKAEGTIDYDNNNTRWRPSSTTTPKHCPACKRKQRAVYLKKRKEQLKNAVHHNIEKVAR